MNKFAFLFAALIATHAVASDQWTAGSPLKRRREWISPDGTCLFSYSETKRPYKEYELTDYHLVIKKKGSPEIELKDLDHGWNGSETAGFPWIQNADFEWIGNRFLAFKDEDELSVIDAEKARFLINHTFANLAMAPKSGKFAYISYRGRYRNGGFPYNDPRCNDTIGVVDLSIETLNSLGKEDLLLDHCPHREIDGVAASPIQWTPDEKGIALIRYKQSVMHLTIYSAKSLKPVADNVLKIEAPTDTLFSAGVDKGLVPQLDKEIKRLLPTLKY